MYSYRAAFDDSGYLAVYAGTAPERVQETLEVIETELARLVRDGLPAAELDAAKGHLTGSLAMSLETSASRMRRLGRSELVEGEIPTLDEVIARIDAVTADDTRRVIDRVFAGPRAPRGRRPPRGARVSPSHAMSQADRSPDRLIVCARPEV